MATRVDDATPSIVGGICRALSSLMRHLVSRKRKNDLYPGARLLFLRTIGSVKKATIAPTWRVRALQVRSQYV